MRSESTLESGAVVGRWTVQCPMGSGGFGTVYRARGDGGEQVALKVAHPSSPQATTARGLVAQQNEMEVLTRLDHPSVVRLRGGGHFGDGRLFMAMELVEGQPLGRWLAGKRRLEPIEAIRFLQRIAEAVAYCHEHGVLHLDLKPQNIIVVDAADPLQPRLKVLDFGLARLAESWSAGGAGMRAGTPAYLPPEAFGPERVPAGPSFDLYALGTILYQLLTGALPYGAEGARDPAARPPVPVRDLAPEVPAPLAALVHALIAPDPVARPRSVAELLPLLREHYYAALGAQAAAVAPEGEAAGPVALPLAGESRFIGRAEELGLLLHRYAEVRAGKGRAVLVEADAGVGKSRLVAEFLRAAQARGEAVIGYGRCREVGFDVPFAALREALGEVYERVSRIRGAEGDSIRARVGSVIENDAPILLKIAPEFASFAPGLDALDGRRTRMMGPRHLAMAVFGVLTAVAETRPVVLVIEDLHWADEGTRAMQAEMAKLPAPASVMFVGSQRPGGRTAFELLAERLVLEPLRPSAQDEQIRSLLGACSDRSLERLKEAVPLLRLGNPLFAIHTIKSLLARRQVAVEADGEIRLDLDPGERFQAPDTVAAALGLTLRAIAPGHLRVLGVAALFGRSFLRSDLEALGLFGTAEVEDALAAAASASILHQDGDVCLLVHDLIRDHLVGSNDPGELPGCHRRIALRLADRGAEKSLLAHHFERAGMWAEAGRSSIAACKNAEEMHDPGDALAHLFRASRVLRELAAEAERDEMLVFTCQELARIGGMMSVTAVVLDELRACADAVPEPTVPQKVALGCAFARVHYTRGEFLVAVSHAQECLGIISGRPDLGPLACVPLNILGRALAASGQFGQAVQLLTKGCALADKLGEHVELSHSEGLLSVALGYTGAFEQAHQRADSCYRTATRLLDPVRTAGAFFYRSVVAETEFDWRAGVVHAARILQVCEEYSISGIYLQLGALMSGRHQFHVGHVRQAAVLLRNSLNLAEVMGVMTSVGWAWAFLGDAQFVAGEYADARRSYERGLDREQRRSREDLAAGIGLIGLAHLEAATGGDRDRCVALAEESLQRCASAANVSSQVHALQRYAESMELLGDGERARELWARMEALVQTLGCRRTSWWPDPPRRRAVLDAVALDEADLWSRYYSNRELWSATPSESGSAPDSEATSADSFGEFLEGKTQASLLHTLATIEKHVPAFVFAEEGAGA